MAKRDLEGLKAIPLDIARLIVRQMPVRKAMVYARLHRQFARAMEEMSVWEVFFNRDLAVMEEFVRRDEIRAQWGADWKTTYLWCRALVLVMQRAALRRFLGTASLARLGGARAMRVPELNVVEVTYANGRVERLDYRTHFVTLKYRAGLGLVPYNLERLNRDSSTFFTEELRAFAEAYGTNMYSDLFSGLETLQDTTNKVLYELRGENNFFNHLTLASRQRLRSEPRTPQGLLVVASNVQNQ